MYIILGSRPDPITVKRRQSPPGIRVTQCDFGTTWRHPITNGFEQ
ncbi:hypothetical protein [Nitrosomonas sp.]|nr:hypothetical protein [Nitrosomonas sp.]